MKKKTGRDRQGRSADPAGAARHGQSPCDPAGTREPLRFNTALPALPPPETFLSNAAELGITFDEGDLERLGRYLAILLEANRVVNLTAIREPEEAWERHILDALTLLPLLGEVNQERGTRNEERGTGEEGRKELRLIDVGTGGGLPGIPLAIVSPQMHVTLLEATGKKAAFLRAATGALGLGNTEVIQERAETMGQNRAQRERYDVAVARAVGHLAMLAELIVPLVRRGGLALAVKGEQAEREVEEADEAIGTLGARFAGIAQTPTGRIVVLEKASLTPRTYPRRSGEPKRSPIGL